MFADQSLLVAIPQVETVQQSRGDKQRVVRDLERAYDHIRDQLEKDDPNKDAKFYNDASRDLYNAARRDVEAGRIERGGELARAAEAMSHVNPAKTDDMTTAGAQVAKPIRLLTVEQRDDQEAVALERQDRGSVLAA